MSRRTHGTKPLRESVFTDLSRVLKRVRTQIAEDVGFQVPTLFVVADVLDASDLSSGEAEVEVVNHVSIAPSHSDLVSYAEFTGSSQETYTQELEASAVSNRSLRSM
jgi:hypothetical protein